LNLFSGFLTILDKNLKIVQENTIDIKDNLKETITYPRRDNQTWISSYIWSH